MKRPPAAWIAGILATTLLMTFAYPVRIPHAPLPKIALERLGFVPIWKAALEWTSPGWLLGEIALGMAVTASVSRILRRTPDKTPGASSGERKGSNL